MVDRDTGELFKNGAFYKLLSPQACTALFLLIEKAPMPVPREKLAAAIWPGRAPEYGLSNVIWGLRKVLDDSRDDPQYVEVLPRVGIRFIARVEKLQRQTGTSGDELETGARTALGIPQEYLFLPEQPIQEMGIKSAELTNVRIYQAAGIGGNPVEDLVAVNSDEGLCILNSNTGAFLDFEPTNLTVSKTLFQKAGPAMLITGFGGDSVDLSTTTIEAGDRIFRILFTLPGLCVASAEDKRAVSRADSELK